MHDTPTQVHWHEPTGSEKAGYGKFKRQPLPYDQFMDAEGIPVYRGIGVRRVQDLPLARNMSLLSKVAVARRFGRKGKASRKPSNGSRFRCSLFR